VVYKLLDIFKNIKSLEIEHNFEINNDDYKFDLPLLQSLKIVNNDSSKESDRKLICKILDPSKIIKLSISNIYELD
jgi:hypothetical protein